MTNKPKLRKAIYAVGVAVAGVLLVYGWITQEQAAAWLILFGAICGLAFYNVDTPE